jgi:hypothetical protein
MSPDGDKYRAQSPLSFCSTALVVRCHEPKCRLETPQKLKKLRIWAKYLVKCIATGPYFCIICCMSENRTMRFAVIAILNLASLLLRRKAQ